MPDGVPHDSPQAQIVEWLNGRYDDFVKNLIGLLNSENKNHQVRLTKMINDTDLSWFQ